MPRIRWVLAATATLLLASTTFASGRLAAQQPRPSGAWRLDTERSDSLPSRRNPGGPPMHPGGEEPGMGPGYGPPATGGVGGAGGTGAPDGDMGGERRYRPGRYGKGMSEKDLARIKQTIDLGRESAVAIRIDPDSGLFTRIDAGGGAVTWKIGGGTATEPVVGGGSIKTKVRWRGDALIVERKVDGGGKVTESYGVGLDGRRMLDYVEVMLGLDATTFTRQYVRDEVGEK